MPPQTQGHHLDLARSPSQPRQTGRVRREPERFINHEAIPSTRRTTRAAKKQSVAPGYWWRKVHEHLEQILKETRPTVEDTADEDAPIEKSVPDEHNAPREDDPSSDANSTDYDEPFEANVPLEDDQISSDLEYSDGETPYGVDVSEHDPVGNVPPSAWDSSSEDEALPAKRTPGDGRWCICNKDIADAEFFGCDAPGCEIVWWHQKCVADRGYDKAYISQAKIEEDVWICPACFYGMLVRKVNDTEGREQKTQEQQMAEMDVKLRERGLWIFDDSVQDPTRPADAQTSTDIQQLTNAATSAVFVPAQQRPPLSELKEHASLPAEPAAIQHPLSEVQPQHLSETHQLSMSIYDPRGLELSARLWTSSATVVKEGAGARDGDLTVEYKSGIVLPSGSAAPKDHVRFFCSEASKGIPSVNIPLSLLRAVGADASGFFPPPKPIPGVVSVFIINGVDAVVLRRVADFLRGDALRIKLGSVDEPLNPKQKRWLVQYVHVAHVLRIGCLIKPAMHALCASIVRRPQDWSDTAVTRELLDEITVEGNPARRVLLEVPHCMLPDIPNDYTLPCGREQVDAICSFELEDSAQM